MFWKKKKKIRKKNVRVEMKFALACRFQVNPLSTSVALI